jgi:hypothetical protein
MRTPEPAQGPGAPTPTEGQGHWAEKVQPLLDRAIRDADILRVFVAEADASQGTQRRLNMARLNLEESLERVVEVIWPSDG